MLVGHGKDEWLLTPSEGVVGPVPVFPGEPVHLSFSIDETLQFGQAVFQPISPDGDLFTIRPELVWARVATAGSIRYVGFPLAPGDNPFEVVIDDDAEPGIARVLLAIVDDRGAESLVRVELEIQ